MEFIFPLQTWQNLMTYFLEKNFSRSLISKNLIKIINANYKTKHNCYLNTNIYNYKNNKIYENYLNDFLKPSTN